jgi:hypothetical protein
MSDQQILAAATSLRVPSPVRSAALDLAVLEFVGADAVDFLQGQVTQDVKKLVPGQARPAGYCTAKGRLLASFVMWKATPAEDGAPRVRALVHASIAAAAQKRLSMFVLRSKVKIGILPLHVAGIVGDASLLAGMAGGALPATAWTLAELPTGTWIAAPGAATRWWRIGEAAPAVEQADNNSAHDDWQAADIVAGLPWISAPTQDLFVPQMVNLELIDGVSFTKGCYPGQEIVARSHYLGKLKRRMFAGTLAQAADPAALVGADVFHDGEEQPSGRIVNAARQGQQTVVLFENTLAGVTGTLRAAAADGPAIGVQELPYAVPELAP